jgi:hypothetical protein
MRRAASSHSRTRAARALTAMAMLTSAVCRTRASDRLNSSARPVATLTAMAMLT